MRNQRKPYSETRVNLQPDDPYHLRRYTYLIYKITVFGVEYPSVKSACDALKVGYTNVRKRLVELYRATILASDGFGNPTQSEIDRAFLPNHLFVQGKLFRNVKDAADHFDIPYGYARSAYRRHGNTRASQSEIDAIFNREQYLKRSLKNTEIFVRGKWHSSQSSACREYGVDQETVRRKLSKLVNPSQTEIDDLYFPPDTHTRNPKGIVVRGVEYPSVTAACQALGVSQSTVNARLKKIPEHTSAWIDHCFFAKKFSDPLAVA